MPAPTKTTTPTTPATPAEPAPQAAPAPQVAPVASPAIPASPGAPAKVTTIPIPFGTAIRIFIRAEMARRVGQHQSAERLADLAEALLNEQFAPVTLALDTDANQDGVPDYITLRAAMLARCWDEPERTQPATDPPGRRTRRRRKEA